MLLKSTVLNVTFWHGVDPLHPIAEADVVTETSRLLDAAHSNSHVLALTYCATPVCKSRTCHAFVK
jgi:hypothetical protein